MLGFLLARAGVDVVVLEKHADFFRDFRGDTVHSRRQSHGPARRHGVIVRGPLTSVHLPNRRLTTLLFPIDRARFKERL